MRRGVSLVETLAAVVLVAMLAVALAHTVALARAARLRYSASAVQIEHTLSELRAEAAASLARAKDRHESRSDARSHRQRLPGVPMPGGPFGEWFVASRDGIGVALWSRRTSGQHQ